MVVEMMVRRCICLCGVEARRDHRSRQESRAGDPHKRRQNAGQYEGKNAVHLLLLSPPELPRLVTFPLPIPRGPLLSISQLAR